MIRSSSQESDQISVGTAHDCPPSTHRRALNRDGNAYNSNDRTQGVVITFERLMPIDGQCDDDYWLSDGDDEEVTETDAAS